MNFLWKFFKTCQSTATTGQTTTIASTIRKFFNDFQYQSKNQAWYGSNQTSYPKKCKLSDFILLAQIFIFNLVFFKNLKNPEGFSTDRDWDAFMIEKINPSLYKVWRWNSQSLAVNSINIFLLFLNSLMKTLTLIFCCERIYVVSEKTLN